MGRVIKPDTEGGSPAVLTRTGKGGLLSKGYLRDDPAGAYVGQGETPAYVVTNDGEGVVHARDGTETTIEPGEGYRTIAVVTDRRVVVLVGNADDGDERVTLPLVDVARATAEAGGLVVTMGSGETWTVHAGDGSTAAVAEYVGRLASAWRDLEPVLDGVERTIAGATDHREDGEFEAGIEAAQAARDELAAAADLPDDVADDRPAAALTERVEAVRDHCVATLADLHLGHGRALAERARELCGAGEFVAAHDAYDHARAALEAAAALDVDRQDREAAIEAAIEDVERATGDLAAAPLERAIAADRRAMDADDPAGAVADWCLARERYRTTLALEEGHPERRFEGEPEKIRERVETVTDRILAVAREDGTAAISAGQWFLEAGNADVAREEAATAREIFADAVPVAAEARPDAVDDLEARLAEAEGTLAGAEAAAGHPDDADVEPDDEDAVAAEGDVAADADVEPDDAEDHPGDAAVGAGEVDDPGNPAETDPEPAARGVEGSGADGDPTDGDVEAPAADVERPDGSVEAAATAAANEDGTDGDAAEDERPEAVVGDGGGTAAVGPARDASLEIRLRALDPEGFDELARGLLETEGWSPADAPSDAPYDLRGEPAAGGRDPVAVWTVHRPVAGPIDVDQIEDVAALRADVEEPALVVTSSPTTDEADRAADEASIRVLDRGAIGTALAAGGEDLIERVRPRPE